MGGATSNGVTGIDASSSTATTAVATSTTASSGALTSTSAGGSTAPAQLCVDTINGYRATRGLPPYQRWSANEPCVGQEAETDGTMMIAHYSFGHTHMCGGYGQDECPYYASNPLDSPGITECLALMWAEKDKAECSGCDACDFPYQGCTSCSFEACGHFLNMKSSAFSMVACGFWTGGWYAQDFQ
jgi:hypothetical protein